MLYRRCTGCLTEKSINDFTWAKPGYRRTRCKECRLNQYRDWKKNNPSKHREAMARWSNSSNYKQWQKAHQKEHYRRYRGCYKYEYKSSGNKYDYAFGGLREIAIQRDSEQCRHCGMTRKSHKEKYGRDITVDHIDGVGCNSKKPNNILDNLQTLCLVCHGRKDARRASINKINI